MGFIVPASTLRYGSIFTRFTEMPRAARSLPMDAVAIPFPTPDITPPTTKIYLCPLPARFLMVRHAHHKMWLDRFFDGACGIESQHLVLSEVEGSSVSILPYKKR